LKSTKPDSQLVQNNAIRSSMKRKSSGCLCILAPQRLTAGGPQSTRHQQSGSQEEAESKGLAMLAAKTRTLERWILHIKTSHQLRNNTASQLTANTQSCWK